MQCAVIGVGHLGKFHAEKYARIPDCVLTAVVDADRETADKVAAQHGAEALSDYRNLLGKVDAVSVATPTPTHCEIARAFMEHGAHVLVEKPMCSTVAEAGALLEAAEKYGRTLQIGHIERFNPSVMHLSALRDRPRFIEALRLNPYSQRNNDTSVLLDLMIHDLDIILDLVGEPVAEVRGIGAPVLSDEWDVTNVRLEFSGGCVANLVATRLADEPKRVFRVFGSHEYYSLDLLAPSCKCCRLEDGKIQVDRINFEPADQLLDELTHFVNCVRTGEKPLVTGLEGLRAMELAERIVAEFHSRHGAGGRAS